MELLKLQHIRKSYGTKEKTCALQDFNLTVMAGEMVAIMGKSGSGKSTVLNLLSGIDTLESGSYFFQGTDMSTMTGDQMTLFRRDHIGFVLQHFALIETETIFDNIALPLRLKRAKKSSIKEQIDNIAREFEICQCLSKYPKEISGGEAQRAAIARAVITHPELILADEPTGALDEETSRKIMGVFKFLHQQGNTLIIVTHDPNVAAQCQRTVIIKDGKDQ